MLENPNFNLIDFFLKKIEKNYEKKKLTKFVLKRQLCSGEILLSEIMHN